MGSDTRTSAQRGGRSALSTRARTIVTRSPAPGLAAHSAAAWSAMADASTAYTRDAPAWAAKSERMPEPAPTSTTVAPSKSAALSWMAAQYVPVRT